MQPASILLAVAALTASSILQSGESDDESWPPFPVDPQLARCAERLEPVPGWDVEISEQPVFLTLSQEQMNVQISDDWPVQGKFRFIIAAWDDELRLQVQPGYVNLPGRTKDSEYFWEDVLLTVAQGDHPLFTLAADISEIGIVHNGRSLLGVNYYTTQHEAAALRTAAENSGQDIRFDFRKADATEPFVRISMAPDVVARGFTAGPEILDWRDRSCPVE
ncbi:hypothetical protein [Aquisalinus flavus]|uniref:Uncharacterized protein n=1 Tax=Aquisalinus flavus TaxID=1526572 RepID=A0A8J2V6M2_9PROT|nr:hypothetical protein [Aquisalinus flavus]MBD0425555.1 hypothetical protein [Aquisalinus flavus]UNE48819.1 hypothetical protein FF099_12550 [Aquisalinus flavus]GGD15146.1 hypothetical protein GCM10011342_24880 [Aquisalinus flavus]